MAKIRYMIEVYEKQEDGNDYLTTPDLIVTDAIALDSDGSISTSADSFQFRIQNYRKADGTFKYVNSFRVDDRVMLYITGVEDLTQINKNNPTDSLTSQDTYLRFDGAITEITEEITVDGRIIVITGLNRLEKMMNIVFPGIFKNKYPSTMIKELIGHVNDSQRRGSNVSLNQISFDDTSIDAATTYQIDFSRNYRTVFELIEELSRQAINKHFNAYYYLDSNNKFYWKQKSKDNDGLEIEEGVDAIRFKWMHKVWDVINAMIVDVGKDVYGRAIHAMNYDAASAAEYGLKWAPGIEVETEIAEGLKGQVQLYAQENREGGWVDTDNDGFPDSYSPAFNMGFKDRGADGSPTGSNLTVTSNSQFNNAIRKEAKWRGVEWIKSVLDLTGKVRPRCDVQLRGYYWETGILDSSNQPLNQGDFVKLIPKSTSVDYKEFIDGLRLVAISHTLDRNGWVVDLNFETDVKDFIPSRYTG